MSFKNIFLSYRETHRQYLVNSHHLTRMDFTNKVVIVTGGSSGIGAAAAVHLSKLGAKLVITGRNEGNLAKTAEQCEGDVLLTIADVNVEVDREKIITAAFQKFGRIDVLVNNAGVGYRADMMSTSMESFDDIMNTNVRSVFHLTQLSVPHLIKTKGNIVNVSSIAAVRANPSSTVYSISKAAIDQFTRCVALELAPMGVRVNAINPALIVTEFHKRLGMDKAEYENFVMESAEKYALKRVGNVKDTSNAIAFLACNELSSFITGTTLLVDGGKAVMCPR